MKPWPILTILLLIPLASATTITTNERFIAASYASDGASVPAGGTQYFNVFGLHSPRNTESDSESVAAFDYTVTNFTLRSNVAGCGGLSGAQTFSFRFRLDGVDTILGGNCTSSTAAGNVQVDTDIVQVTAGQALTVRVTLSGALIGVPMRIGVGMEGYRNESFTFDPGTGPPGPEGAAFTLIELPGLTDEQSGAMLLFLAFLLFAWFQRWVFVAIACLIGILDLMFKDAGGPAPIFGFEFTLLLLVLAVVLQVLVDIRDARAKEKGDTTDE